MTGEPEDAPADIITSAGAASLDEAKQRRQRYAELDAEKREIDARKRAITREMAGLEAAIIDDFIELGTDAMRVVVGDVRKSVYLDTKLWAGPKKTGRDDDGDPKVTDEDWTRAVRAAHEAGCGHLVQERFNGQSFTSWLRAFRDEHGPNWRDALPSAFFDAIEITDDNRLGVRKA